MYNNSHITSALNKHLLTQFNIGPINSEYRILKSANTKIVFKSKYHFLTIKFKGFKFSSSSILKDGFFIELVDLMNLGISGHPALPFYEDIKAVKSKMKVYTDACQTRIYLAKTYVYFPFNEDKLRFLLVFDTMDNFVIVSDIPELLTNPVGFVKNKMIENFYIFLHTDDDFKNKIEVEFYKIYQKRRSEDVTKSDFLVSIMETI